MKKLTTLLGTSLFAVSGLVVPMTAMAYPQSAEPKAEESLPNSISTPISTVSPSQKMALYSDCLRAHEGMSGADFKQVNKFCSCVADQTIQGDSTLSSCSTGGEGGGSGGGGGTFGMIGEMAPSIITGVVQGITSKSGKSRGGGGLLGGGLLDGLGGLLGGGGGLLGGGGGGIGDILKGR
jgi:hypothetical protein